MLPIWGEKSMQNRKKQESETNEKQFSIMYFKFPDIIKFGQNWTLMRFVLISDCAKCQTTKQHRQNWITFRFYCELFHLSPSSLSCCFILLHSKWYIILNFLCSAGASFTRLYVASNKSLGGGESKARGWQRQKWEKIETLITEHWLHNTITACWLGRSRATPLRWWKRRKKSQPSRQG